MFGKPDFNVNSLSKNNNSIQKSSSNKRCLTLPKDNSFGIRDMIKSNKFTVVEQLFASKLKFLNYNKEHVENESVSKQYLNGDLDDCQTMINDYDDYDVGNYEEDTQDNFNKIDFKESNNLTKIHQLKTKYEEEQLFQRQISMILREFYQNSFTDWKRMAKYCNEVIYAQKCLLIAGEKQSLIQQEIKKLESQNGLIFRMLEQQDLMHPQERSVANGCLAIRNVTLKLRDHIHCENFFKNQNECFLLCLIEHKSNLLEKPVLNINKERKDPITIDVNEIFFNLDPNFCVVLKFYFMFNPNYVHHNVRNWKNFIRTYLLWEDFWKAFRKNLFQRKRPLDINKVNLISVRESSLQNKPESQLSSNFSLLGKVQLNCYNAKKQLLKLEQFNYCSIFEDEVLLDSEMSYDYKL